jgi:hypothetical protein
MPRFSEKSGFFAFFTTFLKNPKNQKENESIFKKLHFLKIYFFKKIKKNFPQNITFIFRTFFTKTPNPQKPKRK